MTPMEQEFYGIRLGQDYPLPIVEESARKAREKVYRKHPLVKKEQKRLMAKHAPR